MNWLRRLIPSIGTFKSKSKVPDGLWSSCKKCESVLYAPELEKSLFVCPKCDYHLRIGARQRLDMFLDNTNYSEIAPDLTKVSAISSACSPESGCDRSSSSIFTPKFSAYFGSSACSASMKAAVPPCFCA